MVQILNILKQTDIFYDMTPTQLELAARICREQSYDASDIIFAEGTAGDELYIIIQGEVEILVSPELVYPPSGDSQSSSIVATLRRGQSFGEMALVDQGLRSATARAIQKNTRVLVFHSEQLRQLCEEYPLFGYRLMCNLAADLALKMRNTDSLLRQEISKSQSH